MPDPGPPPPTPAGPRGEPVPSPGKRRVVHGLLVGAAAGGALGALNLGVSDVGDRLTASDADPAGWHAAYASYTGRCVFGGGLIGLLGGAAAVMRERYRGGREAPPAGAAG